MLLRISRNSIRIIAVLSQHRRPSQIAWGIAIGIMLGLVPKDNLIALALIAVLACLRINQLVACATAIAFGLLNAWFSPLTSMVGTVLLDQTLITSGIVYIYQFPVLPWTCLENTQVLGGICLGFATLLPTYAICVWSISKANLQLESIALERVANEAIQYRKSVADQSKTRHAKPVPSLKILADENSIADTSQPIHKSVSVVMSAETADSLDTIATSTTVSPNPILQAQTELAAETKQSKPSPLHRTNRNSRQRTIPTIFTGEIIPDGNDTFLRETVIEVVRYRKPPIKANETIQNETIQNVNGSSNVPPTQGLSMPLGNASTMDSNDKSSTGLGSAGKAVQSGQTIVYDSGHSPNLNSNRDESLRYLLWHINGSRESVRKSSEKTA